MATCFLNSHERIISYAVRRSARAKHVRIAVRCDGAVSVTQPVHIPLIRIEEIVVKKLGWIMGKIDFFKKLGISRGSTMEYRKLRESAFALVSSRIAYFNGVYDFSIKKISIRNQRTRWGSCSRKGNLNFNYRIVNLAPELVDYIVVHELCHLVELNHSKNFWKLVQQTLPEYGECRKALKQNSI